MLNRLIQGQIIVHGLFTEILKLVDKLINTFLCFFAFRHLRSHALLGQTARLTISLTETFFGGELLDTCAVVYLELGGRISL